jgi:high affinity sulfate transporter 1
MTVLEFLRRTGVFKSYNLKTLHFDLLAGLSVAAIEVPTAMAYAELAGFPPVIGIYSSILPLVAYAFLGSSRHLIVGPDAATCTIVAAALVPLAANDPGRYLALSMALSMIVGVMCIAAGFLRLGVIADLLSRPILTGFMNGIALTIVSKQLGGFCGFALRPNTGFFMRVADFVSRLGEVHGPTLLVGSVTLTSIWIFNRVAPRVPGPLVGVGVGLLIAATFDLRTSVVALIGAIPAGIPLPMLPVVSLQDVQQLSFEALGILLVSFCSAVATAKSFAARNGYDIDPNRELIALGAANIVAGISQGFAVSGADSRTAISVVAGGKTQMTGIYAAVLMVIVLLFLTRPLSMAPRSSLAAVLIAAGVSLFDLPATIRLFRMSRREFWVASVAALGVITIGVGAGIVIAVLLTVLTLLLRVSRPHDAILGRVPGTGDYSDIEQHPDATAVPELLIYRFDSSLVFFNAEYFKRRVRSAVAAAAFKPWAFIFDVEAVTMIDITAAYAVEEVRAELESRGIDFIVAHSRTALREQLVRYGVLGVKAERFYPSVKAAVAAFLARQQQHASF